MERDRTGRPHQRHHRLDCLRQSRRITDASGAASQKWLESPETVKHLDRTARRMSKDSTQRHNFRHNSMAVTWSPVCCQEPSRELTQQQKLFDMDQNVEDTHST